MGFLTTPKLTPSGWEAAKVLATVLLDLRGGR